MMVGCVVGQNGECQWFVEAVLRDLVQRFKVRADVILFQYTASNSCQDCVSCAVG